LATAVVAFGAALLLAACDDGSSPDLAVAPAGSSSGVVATTVTAGPAPAGVAVFGDSLTLQAWLDLAGLVAEQGQLLRGAPLPGEALCDARDDIELTLATRPPVILVVAFVGNNNTPCTERATGEELGRRYEEDARAIVAAAGARGVPVRLVTPPAMGDPTFASNADAVASAYAAVADEPGVELVDGRGLLSPDGYATALPCEPAELVRPSCTNGAITVRDPDGLHLSAPDATGYSGGARRWARTLAAAAGLAIR
jgi:lysophospholipase L1-like esterase